MKNVCLENYGVSKLETYEAKAINGGGIIWAILGAALIVGLILGLSNGDDGCQE